MCSKVCLILTVFVLTGVLCHAIEIKTNLGTVKGIEGVTRVNQVGFVAFTSIPFAKPPTGSLRFMPPQAVEAYDKLIDGSASPFPICPQLTPTGGPVEPPIRGQEDCLYLNVFVPKAAFKANKQLPVMVFIRGGGFIVGSGDSDRYHPGPFLETEEVIMVTINYRLGPLGFLSMEDSLLSGNMGLKDQIMALRWIKDQISHFHGNPESVTICGDSAGGTSVMTLMVSEAAKGLFHQAISQSGPLLHNPSTFLGENPAYYASSFIEAAGCDGSQTTQIILKCLQKQDLENIVGHSNMFERFFLMPNPWKPIVDGNFSKDPILADHPKALLQSGKFNQVPLIMGSTKDEGAMYLPQFLRHPDRMAEVNENFDVFGPILLLGGDEHSTTDDESNTANILKYHFVNGDFDAANLEAIVKMLSFARFIGPIHYDAQTLMKTSRKPVYYYNYRYRGVHTLPDRFGDGHKSRPDLGVSHHDEMYLLFDVKDCPLPAMDQAIAKKLVRLWVNFAKSGVPDPLWQPLGHDDSVSDPQYAILDEGRIRMEYDPDFKKDMEFMSNLFDLTDAYRAFDIGTHPAIKNLMKARESEAMEDGNGLVDEIKFG
eukprot:maker-scaffold415_size178368-snap-gene-0.31 protein:Tk01175 transcript:maker-scaffold415_size178368-snap-gene-0.31-mRNA-1 annotation:"venom carboxylesterase-6-like"